MTTDEARRRLRAASAALADAFRALANRLQPVYRSSVVTTAPVAAILAGRAARLTPVSSTYSVLRTTETINTEPSTVWSSSSPLGLDVSERASTIRSTTEMNTATTSLSAHVLSFNNSTSQAQLSGSYSGSATSLRIKLTSAANVSSVGSAVSFNLLDQDNQTLAAFTGTVTAGQVIDLGSTGLTVRFTAGSLGNGQNATTNVSPTPTDVSTTALFDAGWGSAPVFENFQQVTAGSFTLNGVSITVNADDSIDSVVSRINSSSAGVTASVSGDNLTLATNAATEGDIVLANDTSGFLAATKLSGATTTRGNIRDDQQVLSSTTPFAAVTSGSFTINGVSISVDPIQDTLQAVIGEINSAGAGVTASYDGVADTLTLTPDLPGATIALENDTSGFVAAARLAVTVGTNVNADAAFNATGADAPHFDPGLTVQAGSFSVNGVTVAVADDDTVNTVLARITASAAGVTATFDAATQTVKLTSTQATVTPITVGDDTSGFLAAVKLDETAESTTEQQSFSPFGSALDEMAEYSAVQAGTVTANGHEITIDPATTTIRGLVSALNGIADVSATLDEATGVVTISSRRPPGTITFSDTSGVLSALGISTGIYRGSPGVTTVIETQTGTVTVSNARAVAESVSAATEQLNEALSLLGSVRDGTPQFTKLETTLRSAIAALGEAGAKGLSVSTHGADLRLTVDRDKLARALTQPLGSESDLDAATGGLLAKLPDQMSALAAPSAPESRGLPVGSIEQIKTQLVAEQMASTMLLLRSSWQTRTPDASAFKKAATAYADQRSFLAETDRPSSLRERSRPSAGAGAGSETKRKSTWWG